MASPNVSPRSGEAALPSTRRPSLFEGAERPAVERPAREAAERSTRLQADVDSDLREPLPAASAGDFGPLVERQKYSVGDKEIAVLRASTAGRTLDYRQVVVTDESSGGSFSLNQILDPFGKGDHDVLLIAAGERPGRPAGSGETGPFPAAASATGIPGADVGGLAVPALAVIPPAAIAQVFEALGVGKDSAAIAQVFGRLPTGRQQERDTPSARPELLAEGSQARGRPELSPSTLIFSGFEVQRLNRLAGASTSETPAAPERSGPFDPDRQSPLDVRREIPEKFDVESPASARNIEKKETEDANASGVVDRAMKIYNDNQAISESSARHRTSARQITDVFTDSIEGIGVPESIAREAAGWITRTAGIYHEFSNLIHEDREAIVESFQRNSFEDFVNDLATREWAAEVADLIDNEEGIGDTGAFSVTRTAREVRDFVSRTAGALKESATKAYKELEDFLSDPIGVGSSSSTPAANSTTTSDSTSDAGETSGSAGSDAGSSSDGSTDQDAGSGFQTGGGNQSAGDHDFGGGGGVDTGGSGGGESGGDCSDGRADRSDSRGSEGGTCTSAD